MYPQDLLTTTQWISYCMRYGNKPSDGPSNFPPLDNQPLRIQQCSCHSLSTPFTCCKDILPFGAPLHYHCPHLWLKSMSSSSSVPMEGRAPGTTLQILNLLLEQTKECTIGLGWQTEKIAGERETIRCTLQQHTYAEWQSLLAFYLSSFYLNKNWTKIKCHTSAALFNGQLTQLESRCSTHERARLTSSKSSRAKFHPLQETECFQTRKGFNSEADWANPGNWSSLSSPTAKHCMWSVYTNTHLATRLLQES